MSPVTSIYRSRKPGTGAARALSKALGATGVRELLLSSNLKHTSQRYVVAPLSDNRSVPEDVGCATLADVSECPRSTLDKCMPDDDDSTACAATRESPKQESEARIPHWVHSSGVSARERQPALDILSGRVTKRCSLLKKLSVKLVDTYKLINETYYQQRECRQLRAASQSPSESYGSPPDTNQVSESSGRASVNPKEIIHDRYVIGKVIGKGSFGQVILAFDLKHERQVAVKVIRSSEVFQQQALKELSVLRCIARGPEGSVGKDNTVRVLNAFRHVPPGMGPAGEPSCESDGFQCIVFELLSHSLYDVIRTTNMRGVGIPLVRKFSVQILRALQYLRSLGIMHCDLKPENVLLCDPSRSAVKLVDFGSSCRAGDSLQYSYVQSRFYRAPEVVLGLPYSYPIDMWSLACLMVEILTGRPLFAGADEHDLLWRVVEVLGPVPAETVAAVPSELREKFFAIDEKDDDKNFEPSVESVAAAAAVVAQAASAPAALRPTLKAHLKMLPGARPPSSVVAARIKLRQVQPTASGAGDTNAYANADVGVKRADADTDTVTAEDCRMQECDQQETTSAAPAPAPAHDEVDEYEALTALLERMLTYSPEDRITPEAALAHPFFASVV